METGEVPNPGLLTSHISLTWEAAAVLSLPRTFPPSGSLLPALDRHGAAGGVTYSQTHQPCHTGTQRLARRACRLSAASKPKPAGKA